jgi:hypothetical protein
MLLSNASAIGDSFLSFPDISERSVRFARRAFRVQEVEKFEKLHG